MLETDDGLLTWSVAQAPDRSLSQPAIPKPIHRSAYLDYEGPISGDRGSVMQWDRGTFRWLARSPGRVVVHVNGTRLQGRVEFLQAETNRGSFSYSSDAIDVRSNTKS